MPGATVAADLWINEYMTPHDIWQHGINRILAHRITPFQEMYVVESGAYGKGLVLDGKWQTSTADEFLWHEPFVHAACVTHGHPRRVLIAGGADGGAAREALKWLNMEEVVVVDIDGDAINACREFLPEIHQGALDDPRVRVEVGDAYEIIANTRGWDVIIADLTDPLEEGPAFKLYTKEFYAHCRDALAPGGIFINQVGSTSPPLVHLLSRMVKTVSSAFAHTAVIQVHVPTYGSSWGLAISSERPIDTRPDIDSTNQLLRTETNGNFRMFDGQSLLGMFQTPKYIRDQIAAEKSVYSLASPPEYVGRLPDLPR